MLSPFQQAPNQQLKIPEPKHATTKLESSDGSWPHLGSHSDFSIEYNQT
jgi:hypothetical protein